jgi:branched-chain amino acid transport system permease protein
MAWWRRLLLAAVALGVLFALNAWGTGWALFINARPDLLKHPLYGQFAVYYPVALEIGRWIILAVSLNLINGMAGQFSLGHAAFATIGGYASGAVMVFIGPRLFGMGETWSPGAAPLGWNLLFGASLLVGGLTAAGIGFLVGLPSLRLKGDYLAIVTLGLGEVVRVVIEHIQPVGGSLGFNGLPLITNLFWVYLVVLITIVVVRNIARSGHGRALAAIREDEIAAEAMGVPLTRYKVLAFAIGAFFAGMAGSLYAHTQGSLQPTAAGFLESIQIVTIVVMGGSGSITGSVIAAVVLTLLPEIPRSLAPVLGNAVPALGNVGALVEQYRMVFYALLLIGLMLTRPQGLMGGKELSFERLFRRWRKSSGQQPVVSGQ